MNFWEIIFLFFALQAFLLSIVFLLKKKGDRVANRLMALYTFLFGYNILYNALYWSQDIYTANWVHITFTNMLVWVLYGPILYFYVRRVLFRSKFKLIDLIHFIPFLIVFANYSRGYFMSAEAKLDLLTQGKALEMMYFWWPYTVRIIIVLMIAYFTVIFWFISNRTPSYNKSVWLKWLSASFLGYVLSFSSYFVLLALGKIKIEYDYFIGFSMIAFVGMLTYFAYLQPKVFEGTPFKKLVPFLKYEKTGLTSQYSEELKAKLMQLMDDEKPFLNSELRLNDLADKLNLSRHHASQVINEQFDSRFFDFINKYRIAEAQQLLQEEDDMSVTEVLYACGFNNRVSFYKAFKKFTGLTPTDFRSRNQMVS